MMTYNLEMMKNIYEHHAGTAGTIRVMPLMDLDIRKGPEGVRKAEETCTM